MNFPLHPARCTDFIDNYRAFVDSGDTYPDWDFLDHVKMDCREGVGCEIRSGISRNSLSPRQGHLTHNS